MKIVVPIDFTSITENALKYAIGLTDTLKVESIFLLHVLANEKDAAAASTNLNHLIQKYKNQSKAKLDTIIKPGNIFDEIGKAAAEAEGSLIVMGTHGIKGMQHIIGSRAMKVITNSETPYIVIQDKPYRPVKKILVPVDFTREVKQMLPLIGNLNDKFKADIFLTRQQAKDEFINDKINNNLSYFKAYLQDNNIPFKESGSYASGSKYKDVLREADVIDADLIVTTIDPETNITNYIMGVEEQKLVANESKIPVLCINIKHFMQRKGGIFELIS